MNDETPESALEAARELLGRKDTDAALPLLEEPAAAGDAFAARTLGIALRDRGDLAGAERWYRAAADHDGGCAFGLATLLQDTGDLDGAAAWYARGTALGHLECTTNGAILMLARGETAEGERLLREAAAAGDHVAAGRLEEMEELAEELAGALDRPRTDADPEYAAGLDVPLEPDQYERLPHLVPVALEVLDAAIAAADAVRLHLAKALLLDGLGRDAEAERVLAAASERFPGDPLADRLLGLILKERGDLAGAGARLRAAAARGGASAALSLGRHEIGLGRWDEAERWLTEARDLGDEDGPAAALDALPGYRAMVLPDPPGADLRAAAGAGDAAAAFELAAVLRDRYEMVEAVRWFEAAERAGHPGALLELARLRERTGVLDRFLLPRVEPAAEAAHARAAAAAVPDPADVELIEWLGQRYLKAGRTLLAGLWLRRAARLGNGRAAWWAGGRSEESGDPQEAERMWALAARNGVPWCGWLAGRSLVRRGAHAEAEPLLRIAWDARDDREPLHEAAYWLALSLRGQDRPEEALEWARTAVEVHPRVRLGYSGFMLHSLFDPEVELAVALAACERDEEAGPLLERKLAEQPRHRDLNRAAAEVAARRGDADAARAHLVHAGAPEQAGAGVSAEDVLRILRSLH
ncbi:hypothetical protein [Actinomadura parmotrematis]|uniref:Tetratricopeptide repeat protein n=1 Tax=Actinomadura parmotrematis TaxID=2864039 RepID=A0ABS7G246_9ACTN|nr:hypothetical protein [Actinomadura parmotrematis]MBW8486787.1 hypothetical protein [Actinomadura parmotrematis]